MDEAPLVALRRKPTRLDSKSPRIWLAQSGAHALFSAGHTGATFLAAHGAFGVLAGVERPALAVTVPTRSGAAVLLDAGANLECRAESPRPVRLMGAAYARVDLGLAASAGRSAVDRGGGRQGQRPDPRRARGLRGAVAFIGNIGAQDCSPAARTSSSATASPGNIALKVGEGVVDVVDAMLREELSARPVVAHGRAGCRGAALRRFRQRVDYAEYGGGAAARRRQGRRWSATADRRRGPCRSGDPMAARLVEERVLERLAEALAAVAVRPPASV